MKEETINTDKGGKMVKVINKQGFRCFTDKDKGNIYILKRHNGYCLSQFQTLASLSDMLCLNGEYWFTIKEIKEAISTEYKLNY